MASENDNRVLSRLGARVVTPEEVNMVNGGFLANPYSIPHTNTACTFAVIAGSADGDSGECGTI